MHRIVTLLARALGRGNDESALSAESQLHRADDLAQQRRWDEAAQWFYRAADTLHGLGEHERESAALRRAAQTYEGTQQWRSAGDSWLRTARAYAGHPSEPPEPSPRDPAGEAYMWAGYTFFWADQHYDSWRAHALGGQAFESAGDWTSAERCYMYAAISKALAFASLGDPNRYVHTRYEEVRGVDLAQALGRVYDRRRADRDGRSAANRSHIDALFMVRRALEQVGNQDEAKQLYRREQDARLRHAWEYGTTWRRLTKFLYKWVLGYGEGLANLAVVSVGLFGIAFPSLYAAIPTIKGADNPLDYLYFSLASLTTLDARGMSAVRYAAWVSQAEFLAGLTIFGMLVSVIVRLMQRSS
jgi:tetratricopeptide (TPR) repeat protein